jgi:hypothetical protein
VVSAEGSLMASFFVNFVFFVVKNCWWH